MKVDDQVNEEKWITFEDGAFITTKNWKIRQVVRMVLISSIFAVPFTAILYFTYLDQSDTFRLILQFVGIVGLFFISFRIAKWLGSGLFVKYMNDFLVHYKEDWKK